MQDIMIQFEAIKRQFDGTPKEGLISMPRVLIHSVKDNPENGIMDGELQITE